MAEAVQQPVAELRGISKIYGSGDLEVKALDQLNLTVQEGDYLAVMGASGSGKSTAMNILGCLDRPTSGTYRLNGTAVEQLDDDALADVRNRSLGFVFQQFHLLGHASAMENVMLPMIYAGVPREERIERAQSALRRVGLAQRLENKPNQLSGGQQQRVAIARAIINRPSLLLADEPTGALDSSTTAEVLELFDELHQQGITLVMVTHEDDVAARAQRIARFQDGRALTGCPQ
ncbi:MAG: ABC transporter ATP-binding protein [Cyanobacteria bacterium MAG STY4_bin_9]|uniref:ABC transporter ATP-binding protein n=1 Tax=unclassified Synechococcus TaxID=2626047 RepID=UPI0001213E3E|nr:MULTISPECIES: ABC transporter ATP-binding protein [unclassified Synechococcus]MCH1545983.1 ABC transporter ATP-binding protein [Synechococcus sp. MOX_bin32]MCH1603860.1 ABC transporter ATP-binding protein [Synechococcus sp. MOX_bin13]MCY4084694.1 ABC transporter ATP-binding protein [Cyanobacteria bacterium MAG COS1_bin_9]MDD9803685.1 ABC transporter ATP-binding protein [Cyanobacteria bacterium MAG STY1_bin_7]MDD9862727.1 ABC transporter ATP-binding protein [Cyanobacteria bacterium MAG STY2_